jgi:hypothetical protein
VAARPLGVCFSNLDSVVFAKDNQRFSREQILAVYEEETTRQRDPALLGLQGGIALR